MPNLEAEILYFRQTISDQFKNLLSIGEALPERAIRDVVVGGPFGSSAEENEEIIRELEGNFTVRQSIGSSVLSEYKPWLSARKEEIEFFYWNRLKQFHLSGDSLPAPVISVLDNVTDEILDYCGNPDDEGDWSRRGMVMGHVQSGKTTNYGALICKAADAGYRVIILLAGITNSLRTQTQERMDEIFIGKVSAFNPVAQKFLPITQFGGNRIPAHGTSREYDFRKASTYGVTIEALNEPVIFVTKKNKSTLSNLKEWLAGQTPSGAIRHPLLLIDDEADNASINTTSDPEKTTAINGSIREILALFQRSTYVGYTATPFANIFIDPESDDEMLKDDLFPEHFIKALDPPTNYVGASRVFAADGNLRSQMIREIDDFADILPLKHKKDHPFDKLPSSLYEAIRVYVLTRAIRVLRGQGEKHCSMMINASRFNDVQDKLLGQVYTYLDEVRNSISVNAGLSLRQISDQNIHDLVDDFDREFPDAGCTLEQVMEALPRAISSLSVLTVNMRGGSLDYSLHKDQGLHIIAIGGLALSRGLTLEGLTVSYILRNTAASDTLMQMARWFGYRPDFEDICRLYLPETSLDHYEYVEEATEELRAEIKRMESLGQTPKDFGLKVRQSPTALRVTAANKMRTATSFTVAQDYSGKHIEGHILYNDDAVNKKNLVEVSGFLKTLGSPDNEISNVNAWRNIQGLEVLNLLSRFRFPEEHPHLGTISGNSSLFRDYVSDRIRGELAQWDVVIPGGSVKIEEPLFGLVFPHRLRESGEFTPDLWRPSGRKNRIADRSDARLLLDEDQLQRANEAFAAFRGDGKFCRAREKPLLIIHVVGDVGKNRLNNFSGPVVSLSFCLPETKVRSQSRQYQVNRVYRKQLELSFEDDDDAELMQADE
jgi:hypothetical protein